MSRAKKILVWAVWLLAARTGWAVQTGKVEIGINGAYDGTVWIGRDTSGSLVFRDQQVGSSVTLQQLIEGQSDHGGLSGLGDDDHPQYLESARHQQTHTAAYNDAMPISPDVGNNTTVGGHASDGNIHVVKDGVETILGAWRFLGTPVFSPSLRLETTAPLHNAMVYFGTGYDAPQLRYLGGQDEFEFTRPLRGTTVSLDAVVGERFRVWTNLDGRGEIGVPAATLTNFVSLNGIAAGNLLDRSANEDIGGQWDFLAPVRVFGDLDFEDGTASGVLTAAGIVLTTQSEAAEPQGMFSRLETTTHVLRIVLDKNNNQPAWKRLLIYGGDHATNAAWDFMQDGDQGLLLFRRNSDGTYYLKLSVDSNGPLIGYNEVNSTLWRNNGDIWNRLGSADGSDVFRIKDSSSVDQWTCDSNGNVAMVANAKQTIPDGSDGPFIRTFNAAASYYPDQRETLAPTTRSLTGLEYEGSGDSYVAFPLPNEVLGANVVLDRITIYCAQHGGNGEVISEIVLMDDTDNSVRAYSTSISGDTQWLTSDYTMDDSKSYVIRMEFAKSASGHMQVTRFRVEYHLE